MYRAGVSASHSASLFDGGSPARMRTGSVSARGSSGPRSLQAVPCGSKDEPHYPLKYATSITIRIFMFRSDFKVINVFGNSSGKNRLYGRQLLEVNSNRTA